jgi:hypothetical protein
LRGGLKEGARRAERRRIPGVGRGYGLPHPLAARTPQRQAPSAQQHHRRRRAQYRIEVAGKYWTLRETIVLHIVMRR